MIILNINESEYLTSLIVIIVCVYIYYIFHTYGHKTIKLQKKKYILSLLYDTIQYDINITSYYIKNHVSTKLQITISIQTVT